MTLKERKSCFTNSKQNTPKLSEQTVPSKSTPYKLAKCFAFDKIFFLLFLSLKRYFPRNLRVGDFFRHIKSFIIKCTWCKGFKLFWKCKLWFFFFIKMWSITIKLCGIRPLGHQYLRKCYSMTDGNKCIDRTGYDSLWVGKARHMNGQGNRWSDKGIKMNMKNNRRKRRHSLLVVIKARKKFHRWADVDFWKQQK